LPALIEKHLVGPAGLLETSWDTDPDGAQERAAGYGFRRGGWVRAPRASTSYVGASGAIRSTARDLCRWYEALFGGKVLTPEELRTMMMPATLADGRSTLTRSGSGYGLGIWTGTAGGRRVAWHAGSTAGFAADARHYPDDGVSIAMLGNADSGEMGAEPQRIREAVLNAIAPR
jgi:CubicO group peptidase (beta-lactamase class C family)